MKTFFFIFAIISLAYSIETDLEAKDEICMKFKANEIEGSMGFSAISSGVNHKLVAYKVMNENMEVLIEKRKEAEFQYTINKTKQGEVYRLCIKDLDGTKKTIQFNIFEQAKVSSKPVQKDSFDTLRSLLGNLLEKLRKIEGGIKYREALASNHIDLAQRNLSNIKYGSLAKVFIVALITLAEIFILMKFVEKRERVYPR